MHPPALQIEQLSKEFAGRNVVDDLGFSIAEGEIFGLLGPNGAGKSTTINMICGVTRPGSGSIRVFGEDNQSNYRFCRRQIGVMHQEIVADSFFPIDRALALHSGYFGVPYDRAWVERLIDELQLRPHLQKPMIKLSGGLKRRFMLAKALVHRPRLLILDEPTAGVDIELRHTLWRFVREVNEAGTTILLTTHYLEEAEEMCGRIAILNEGKLAALETKERLLARYGQRRVDLLLAAPLDSLPPSLTPFSPLWEKGDASLSLHLDAEAEVQPLLDVLRNSGISIRRITEEAGSLEDVFLDLTSSGRRKS